MTGWLLLALVSMGAGPAERDWLGPPPRPNAHPFAAIFLSTPPLDPRLPAEASWELHWSHATTMTLSPAILATAPGRELARRRDGGLPQIPLDVAALGDVARANPGYTFLFADGESSRLDLEYTQPFGDRWAVRIGLPVVGHLGGGFDGLISGFHRAFNFGDLFRGLAPADSLQLVAMRGGEQRQLGGGWSPGLGDIVVRGLHAAVPPGDGRLELGLSAALKLPTGSPARFHGSGGWDFGLGVHLGRTWGNLRATAGGGYTWHGRWRGLETIPVADTLDLHLGGEYRFSSQWSFSLSLSRFENALRRADPPSFGKPTYNLVGGLGWQPAGGPEMSFWFGENLTEHNNSSDVSVLADLRWRR